MSAVDSSVPVDVPGLSSIKAISAGAHHSCALTDQNTVKCWGENRSGELGNGSNVDSFIPVDVSSLTGVKAIFAGGCNNCAIDANNEAWCWGNYESNLPYKISNLVNVKTISPFWQNACATTLDGKVKCWLASGPNKWNAIDVPGISDAKEITVGFFTSCATNASSEVYCWGKNTRNALGDNSSNDSTTPVKVVGLSDVQSVFVGGDFYSCALTKSGQFKCWSRIYFPMSRDATSSAEMSELFRLN